MTKINFVLAFAISLLLSACASVPAVAQTACSVLTQQQVLTSLSDNVAPGAITPRTLRDLDCSIVASGGGYVSSSIPSGSAVAVVSATPVDITSVALPTGDWDCQANVGFTFGGSPTLGLTQAWISTVSATSPSVPNGGAFTNFDAANAVAFGTLVTPVGTTRVVSAPSTRVYLSTNVIYSGGSSAVAYGFLGCRQSLAQ